MKKYVSNAKEKIIKPFGAKVSQVLLVLSISNTRVKAIKKYQLNNTLKKLSYIYMI